jgi:hypothetical protein
MKRVILAALLAVFFPAVLVSQQLTGSQGEDAQKMTNADVVKMVEAKLTDDLIIGKIKSSPSDFDTSIDAILKLKAAGASDAVIHAMVDASPTAKTVVKEASLTGGASGLVKVELKTPVPLMVDEPLSSKTSKSGQTFRLVAAEDVLVNGKVVVAKGSSATGRITLVEKGNINVEGRVEVTVDSVRAVDGHNIPLEGQLAVSGVGRWGMGKEAKIQKGASINTVVAKETEVKM